MADEFDPFAGETGLKDDFEGVVTDAFFQKDEQYNRMNAHLKVLADDGEEVELRYPCGADWASFDGGESIEHPNGEKKGFNNRTAYFQLIKRSFESGAEDELRNRSVNHYSGRGPMHAALWKALKFHWAVVTETYNMKDKDTGKQQNVESSRVFPDKFIGTEAQTVLATPAGTVESTMHVVSGQGPLELLSAPTAAAVRAVANSKPYAEWVDEVMSMSDAGQPLINNASLMQALGDENFYNSLKG